MSTGSPGRGSPPAGPGPAAAWAVAAAIAATIAAYIVLNWPAVVTPLSGVLGALAG